MDNLRGNKLLLLHEYMCDADDRARIQDLPGNKVFPQQILEIKASDKVLCSRPSGSFQKFGKSQYIFNEGVEFVGDPGGESEAFNIVRNTQDPAVSKPLFI